MTVVAPIPGVIVQSVAPLGDAARVSEPCHERGAARLLGAVLLGSLLFWVVAAGLLIERILG